MVEVESPQHRSEWGLSQPHSSPIGQVIQQKVETAQNGWMHMAVTSGECQDEKLFVRLPICLCYLVFLLA